MLAFLHFHLRRLSVAPLTFFITANRQTTVATHFLGAVTNRLPDTAIIFIREAINVLSVIAGTELNRDNVRGRTLINGTEVVFLAVPGPS